MEVCQNCYDNAKIMVSARKAVPDTPPFMLTIG